MYSCTMIFETAQRLSHILYMASFDRRCNASSVIMDVGSLFVHFTMLSDVYENVYSDVAMDFPYLSLTSSPLNCNHIFDECFSIVSSIFVVLCSSTLTSLHLTWDLRQQGPHLSVGTYMTSNLRASLHYSRKRWGDLCLHIVSFLLHR